MIYGLIPNSERNGNWILQKVYCWLLTVTVFASPELIIVVSRRRYFNFSPVLIAIFNLVDIMFQHRVLPTVKCIHSSVFTLKSPLQQIFCAYGQ